MRLPLLPLLALAGCAKVPAPICDSNATTWTPGTRAFVERTKAKGLEGVEGVRLSVVDFDGDGWPDLHVSRGDAVGDDFAADGVRRSWLLRNTAGTGFEDVTESSGFRVARQGGALGRPGSIVAFADIDGDGDADAYVGLPDDGDPVLEETSELMINNGDGTFVLGAKRSPVRVGLGDTPAGASFTDVDRDGHVDLWLPQNSDGGQPQQDRLLKGDGDGGFKEVTEDLGLQTLDWSATEDLNAARSHTNAWSAAACDLDKDGWPELLAASYGRAPNHLWHNDGDGFTNISRSSGYASDAGTDWTDNQFAMCHCTLNPGDDECDQVTGTPSIRCESQADVQVWRHEFDRNPYRLGGNSGATMCRDIDNDGRVDLMTSEIHHWWTGSSSDSAELLFQSSDGDILFERPGLEATGLTRPPEMSDWNDGIMTGAILDFDNDGWPDVYFGSSDYPGARGLLYHQVGPRDFEPVPLADGIDHTRSHGVVAADFDGDGDLDVIVGHSRARCGGATDCYETSQIRYFDNQLGGNFIQLDLVGTWGSNTMAIGARVELTANGVTQTQELTGGHGHYGSQADATLHFGLGESCDAQVVVTWPDADGTTDSFRLSAGHRYELVQGDKVRALP